MPRMLGRARRRPRDEARDDPWFTDPRRARRGQRSREKRAAAAEAAAELERYAAELPDPGVLDEYEQVVPGARDRLLQARRSAGDWRILPPQYRPGSQRAPRHSGEEPRAGFEPAPADLESAALTSLSYRGEPPGPHLPYGTASRGAARLLPGGGIFRWILRGPLAQPRRRGVPCGQVLVPGQAPAELIQGPQDQPLPFDAALQPVQGHGLAVHLGHQPRRPGGHVAVQNRAQGIPLITGLG